MFKTAFSMNELDRRWMEMLSGEEYSFLMENEYLGDNILLLGLGGSKAYGTSLPTSDTDVRGIAIGPMNQTFGLKPDFEQVVDPETDTVIYSLGKMAKLLFSCNPNTIELMGLRPEDYIYVSEEGNVLLDHKKAFLSRKAIDTFGGYAQAQLNRLEHGLLGNGANSDKEYEMLKNSIEHSILAFNKKHEDNRLDLELRIIEKDKEPGLWNSMKHSEKAEMTGEDIVCTGAFHQYPITEFKTMISEIHKIQSEFGNLNKRNTKKTDMKLAKHMMHLIRLYLMGIDLNERKEIITYREKEHDLLMSIRNGDFMYGDGMRVRPEFYDLLKEVQEKYKMAVENTVLPAEPNYDEITDVLQGIYKDRYFSNGSKIREVEVER